MILTWQDCGRSQAPYDGIVNKEAGLWRDGAHVPEHNVSVDALPMETPAGQCTVRGLGRVLVRPAGGREVAYRVGHVVGVPVKESSPGPVAFSTRLGQSPPQRGGVRRARRAWPSRRATASRSAGLAGSSRRVPDRSARLTNWLTVQ